MTGTKWKFFTRRRGQKQRDPVQDEFFNNESIVDFIAAFVREVVQNVLDATRDRKIPARVRFFVSGDRAALPVGTAAPYLNGIWPHVSASLPDTPPLEGEPCRYLVVEDFNTTGLRGDHTAFEEPSGDEVNEFFYFFRAEGKSGKTGKARGRWGIGKYVFPRASDIRAFFGLTVRDNDNHRRGPMLMGQAVLKNHTVGADLYEPDGWWANSNTQDVPVPLQDRAVIDNFRSTWNVTRADDESGLSVVIPHVNEEFTADKLVRAVAEDYFIAILTGELVGVVESGDGSPVDITAESLKDLIAAIPGAKAEQLKANAALVEAALAIPEDDYIRVESQDGSPGWNPELINIEERQRMKTRIENDETVAVRVPVTVGRKKGSRSESHFDVYFQPEHGYRGSAIFAREGLIVSGVKCPVSGMRAIVLVRDESLARMLGDAEGPAHLEWSARGTKFTGMYENGRDWLSFIKRAPAEILRITRGEEDEEDSSLAADLFSVPAGLLRPEVEDDTEGDGRGAVDGRRSDSDHDDEDDEDDKDDKDPPGKRVITVTALEDGFSVKLTGKGADVPALRVAAAYDVRRGNPFKKWRPEDFKLSDLAVSVSGGAITAIDGNDMAVEIDNQDDFLLVVRGFDSNRDLKVRARRGGDR
jgi:hypothetical protein